MIPQQGGRKKEKGRVELSLVDAVEKVEPKVFQKDHVFQISHKTEEEPLILYIAASTSNEQELWLDHIRACKCSNHFVATRQCHSHTNP